MSRALPATEPTPARRALRVFPALVLPLLAVYASPGCSKSTEAKSPEAELTLPDPAAEGVKTPEQAAKDAQAGINASNAEAEMQKLEQEIGGG